jgi:hypothetical protein
MPALLQVNPAPEASPWISYFTVIFVLAGLLGLCYLLLRFLGRRIGAARSRSLEGKLELIDRLGLEPRRTLYIVRAGARYMALAASEAGVHFLMEVSREDLVQEAPSPDEQRKPS